MSIIYLHLKCL